MFLKLVFQFRLYSYLWLNKLYTRGWGEGHAWKWLIHYVDQGVCWIKTSEMCLILHITWKPYSIICLITNSKPAFQVLKCHIPYLLVDFLQNVFHGTEFRNVRGRLFCCRYSSKRRWQLLHSILNAFFY